MIPRAFTCVRSPSMTAQFRPGQGLSLQPFRGLRPTVDGDELGRRLCPPYDVIDAAARRHLLDLDPANAVAIILPEPTEAGYAAAAEQLDRLVDTGQVAVDDEPALYVYEMTDAEGRATRGLLGAVELRAAEDGVILPHENTMAGPVADRLQVMTATGADLEPIYLVYDGGGPASDLLHTVDSIAPLASTRTDDGVAHRLWAITDPDTVAAVMTDLSMRRALIADGHHRYATYRERQRQMTETSGTGPWDRGLALVVDSTEYGPQVHAIHRVIPAMDLSDAVGRLTEWATVERADRSPADALSAATGESGFHTVVTDGTDTYVIRDSEGRLAEATRGVGDSAALSALTVSVLHRALISQAWALPDDEEHVGYAHSIADAVAEARRTLGVALLIDATPAEAVAAVAAEGARMPRKSTLFTPKPASGLVMRRLADQV
jgi:uncharacterized protein (DUF1015 family)